MFAKPQEAARDFVLACIPDGPVAVLPAPNGDPLVASAIAMRACLAQTVENIINLLDELDGDPDERDDDGDLEPSLGWTLTMALGCLDDREEEHEAGDDEARAAI